MIPCRRCDSTETVMKHQTVVVGEQGVTREFVDEFWYCPKCGCEFSTPEQSKRHGKVISGLRAEIAIELERRAAIVVELPTPEIHSTPWE